MRLPAKRQKPRSGIERAPKREWPRHRKFVRSHSCSVPGCKPVYERVGSDVIDCAHIKTVGAGGPDWESVSLCRFHHSEQHALGIETVQRRHKIDLGALAAEFVRNSPDQAMRDSLNPQREEGRDAGR